MNTRQALKILSRCYLDPARKPSAQTPYTDAQWCEASRRLRLSFRRGRTPWAAFKWTAGPVTQRRARRRAERRGAVAL